MKRFLLTMILLSVLASFGQGYYDVGAITKGRGNSSQALTYFTEAQESVTDAGTVGKCQSKIAECISSKKQSEEANNRSNNSVQLEQSTLSSGYENGHEWVDLGLSVKWATCNVGASSPNEYGNYFAWGETSTKDKYDWSTHRWCRVNNGSKDYFLYHTNGYYITKYNCDPELGIVDYITSLLLSDDPARVNWGGNWRMPTIHEFGELLEECSWKWAGNGYMVTSEKNGNSIFLPAAGYRDGLTVDKAGSEGVYWSSSLDISSYSAWRLFFDSSFPDAGGTTVRYLGFSVRPVTDN